MEYFLSKEYFHLILNYFQLVYKYLCGYNFYTDILLIELDTENYPVFKVIQFMSPNDTDIITSNTELIIVSNITGSLEFYQNDGKFFTIIDIENNNKNITAFALCSVEISVESIESNFSCHLDIDTKSYQFQNLYLLPYTLLSEATTPFEIFIKDTIKAKQEYIPPRPGPDPPGPTDSDTTEPHHTDPNYPTDFSRYLEYSASMLFVILLII